MFNEKDVLITGATGSLGRGIVRLALERYRPRRLIVFSRDEHKQFEMARELPERKYPCLRYFIGDVRDPERLHDAFHNVNTVIHAAALKQVPAIEYNPFEAIKTNVIGAQNVVRAAIAQGVERVVALSTDKAANPINLYGATKLCADKLFVAANAMAGGLKTKFAVVRFGNLFGCRGSVLPLFLKERARKVLPITDENMTRFSITIGAAARFVFRSLELMTGGEIFVPKIPSFSIRDLAEAVAPDARKEIVGIRAGEKMHEHMITGDDARQTLEFDDHFVIQPNLKWWKRTEELKARGGKQCPPGFSYSSHETARRLSVGELRALVGEFCAAAGNSLPED